MIVEETWQYKDEEYQTVDKEVKKELQNDKRKWLDEKGAETEEAANRNDMRMADAIQNCQGSYWRSRNY